MKAMSEQQSMLPGIIPDKLYFKIGEVAEIIGVKPYVLRYWETEFPDLAPGKSQSKQRLYKRKEVEAILKVRDLLYKEKFTIDGARKRLKQLTSRSRLPEEFAEQAFESPTVASVSSDSGKDREFLLKMRDELLQLRQSLEGSSA